MQVLPLYKLPNKHYFWSSFLGGVVLVAGVLFFPLLFNLDEIIAGSANTSTAVSTTVVNNFTPSANQVNKNKSTANQVMANDTDTQENTGNTGNQQTDSNTPLEQLLNTQGKFFYWCILILISNTIGALICLGGYFNEKRYHKKYLKILSVYSKEQLLKGLIHPETRDLETKIILVYLRQQEKDAFILSQNA